MTEIVHVKCMQVFNEGEKREYMGMRLKLPSQPLVSCMTLGKCPSLSDPQLPDE